MSRRILRRKCESERRKLLWLRSSSRNAPGPEEMGRSCRDSAALALLAIYKHCGCVTSVSPG